MSAATTTDNRKMGAMTIFSSLIIVAMLVWGTYSFVLIQFGFVRTYEPHTEYETAPHFGYDINWSGGRTNWFDNINYTDLPLDQQLPEDLLAMMNNTLFYVSPSDPPQLWRSTAYDEYDGSSWSKTSITPQILTTIDRSMATNQIYRVYLNVSTGPSGGQLEIPTLFPDLMIITDSFETGDLVDGRYTAHSESMLESYELFTDEYGTALLSPFIVANASQIPYIFLSYEVTYADQDLINVATTALNGDQAPSSVWNMYTPIGIPLSPNVVSNASQFSGVGNAYETAVQVEQYFRNNFSLLIDDYNDRPAPGQEVTDWFLERGGGLPMDFVTAYCVFLRHVGVPARPALGHAIGEDMGAYREIQVRHMMFWAEVFIPMSGHPDGGEWIQVIPIPLPGDLGGNEIPENTGQGNVQLWLWPNLVNPWVTIGTEFDMSALLMVDYIPITNPETITFYDNTDFVSMGSAVIQSGTSLPLANVSYTFPAGATVGFHNITATFTSSTFSVSNWTAVYAVSQPIPMESPSSPDSEFILSEVIDVDIKLGLDGYVAFWNDTLDIRGVMTDSEENPVDGSALNNPWMIIKWDDQSLGSAQILADGSYRMLVNMDGSNSTLMSMMSPGTHELWALYLGEYNPFPPYNPIYLPGQSLDNSTVTIYGAATSNLIVTPIPAYRGANLHYEGTLELLNGTVLAFESVDFYFNGAYLATRVTDATGFFQYDYPIPLGHALGWFDANVTWSSPIPSEIVNLEDTVPVEIRLRPTDLTNMDSWPVSPMAVHIAQNITIYGNLLDGVNGTGLAGRTVDFWWDDGTSVIMIGSNTTEAGGWYQFDYTVPAGYEGFVDYWVNFTSMDGYYDNTQSPIRSIEVKKWDVGITLLPVPDPSYRLDTISIEGIATFTEGPWPFSGANISIWWNNQTDGLQQIGWAVTNSSGGYLFYHTIPLGHELGNITLYTSFESPYINVADGESPHYYPDIQARPTILTINSNGSFFYLNETVYISGQLLDGATPIVGELVTIVWDNGTTQSFMRFTNGTGHYNMTYPLSLDDPEGTVVVTVDYAGGGPYSPANSTLIPSLRTQLYQTEITPNVINGTYHLDEVLYYSGQLTFPHNGNPIVGATIAVHFVDGNGERTWPKETDSAGWFSFQYNFTLADLLGGILIWSEYLSTDPLWGDANSGSQSASVELYELEITPTLPGTVYLDQGVVIQGNLTYLGGSPAIASEDVYIYISQNASGPWTYIGFDATDGTGFFTYTHFFTVPPDTEGSYYFKCNYTSTDPLNDDATTSAIEVIAQRYQVSIDIVLTPNPVYQNETLMVSARLYYTLSGIGISGETIELYWLNGSSWRLDTVPLVTNVSGWVDFYYSGMDEDTIRTGIEIYGTYDGSLLLQPAESFHEPLTLQQWQTVISGFVTDAASYYILDTMEIYGNLTYVVGPSPIGGVFVDILVDGSPVGANITLWNGAFNISWLIPESITPGLHQIAARFLSPYNWVADYTTLPLSVDFLQYVVNITATIDTNPVYRGSSTIISGTLQFDDGTPMVGYQVEIHWVNSTNDWTVATITITDVGIGFFSHTHDIGWGHDVGNSGYYVAFVRPNAAFQDAFTTPEIVEVRDDVVLHLDATPTDQLTPGYSITISGYVTNGGGRVIGVPLEIFDGVDVVDAVLTDDSGSFSVDYIFPNDHPRGVFFITLDLPAVSFYDLAAPSDSWSLAMNIGSSITVDVGSLIDVQPGERFSFDTTIIDDQNFLVNDATIRIYLNETLVFTRDMTAGDWSDVQILIPLSWSTSGFFEVIVEWDGDAGIFVLGSSGASSNMIHIFTEVNFDFFGTPLQVSPSTGFTITVTLTDDHDIPIRNRPITFSINGTIVQDTTDALGVANLPRPGYTQQGFIDVTVTLTSADIDDRTSVQWKIEIVLPGTGFPSIMDLLLPLAAIGAAVVVLLMYLYFVRGFGKAGFVSVSRDLASKLRSIKKLADAGKYAAAISLTYRTFEDMCGSKTGMARSHSETARDYAERILKQLPLDSKTVSELLQAYEEARFSHHEMTEARYDDAMRVFTDLYPRVEAVTMTE